MARSDEAYFHLIAALWAGREPFLLVEHDIEIADRPLRQAKHCKCWWSVSPYAGGFGPDELLDGSLGFTRFRTQLMDAVPDLMARAERSPGPHGPVERNWRCLDARILGALRAAGHRPHVHDPVVQHHVYGGVCSCGDSHPELEVDSEGRYRP